MNPEKASSALTTDLIAVAMASSSATWVLAFFDRSYHFNFGQASSMGFMSGE